MDATLLHALGFGPWFEQQFVTHAAAGLVPSRITSEGRGHYRLVGGEARIGELRGRLRLDLSGLERPAVGDWVAVRETGERAIIHAVLPRRTVLVRRAAGSEFGAQVLAANLDLCFVVTAVGRDFNPRRIERYLAAIADGGAGAVVVINKVDLAADVEALVGTVRSIAPGVRVACTSTVTPDGVDTLRDFLADGITIGLVGSSGVGKSSLVNRLLGHVAQDTREVRRDEKGRHATTRRDLILLPDGGVLIDTPGMREFGLVDDGGGMDTVFSDIAELAAACHFDDCCHETEPGCAVLAAVEAGHLDPARLESYHRLQREIAAAARRRDPLLAREAERKWKSIHKSMRQHYKKNPHHKP
jgi:ribosome biogenesis GTPase